MRALTIGELETESGASRSTIYYYVRAGLLPPAQKSSPTRALYTDDHVELLDEIRRLKQDGLDIKAIREQLRHRVHSASQNGEDLVARQGEQTRRSILRTAAREFARNGYRQTRIADIIAELGITPQVLYSHFPTKRDLFAAAYRESLDISMSIIEPRLDGRGGPGGPPPVAHGGRLRAAGRSTPICSTSRARPPTTTRRRPGSCAVRTSTC